MEKYPVFMKWKIGYCLDGNTHQRDLQIQCNLFQNPSWILCRNWQSDPKIHMERTQNSQNNLGKGGGVEDSYFLISKLTIKPQ